MYTTNNFKDILEPLLARAYFMDVILPTLPIDVIKSKKKIEKAFRNFIKNLPPAESYA